MAYTENCLFLEARTGDGGVHDPAPYWWLSPDVDIIAPIAGQGTGPHSATDPAVNNTIQVRLHKKSECTGFTSNNVFVDVFVGDPSLVMTRGANVKKVVQPGNVPGDPSDVAPVSGFVSGVQVRPVTWPLGFATSGIEAPGHKCLIAQIYQELDTPPANFDLPTEPHTAQHNITICHCASPCGQEIQTTTVGKKPEAVGIRAFVDLEPTARVTRLARSLLAAAKVEGFRRFRTVPPPRFGFEFPKGAGAKTREFKGAATKAPSCDARLTLKPGKALKFRLVTDLAFAAFGDAFIFHVIQTGANGRPQGGLTVVFVRLKKA